MLRRTLTACFAVASFGWTVSGETSDPTLAARDLPADIASECRPAGCAREGGYVTRWIGRARAADLFLVLRETCESEGCPAWLVRRDPAGTTTTLLTLSGEFRFDTAAGPYPAVHTRTELTAAYASYNRYEWDGTRYVRMHTRLVHRVDGVECGNETECDAAAREALAGGAPDRAVRIWQEVHGVAWI
ncbi:hypothetical protein SVA_0496 [Sulfurifustis variabilis]|uniref:Uncharacterized protein n=1 Tax=Sulfurifustis variabilis TaxID=1675686 RepID=A0A1B4VCY7_9GAMM|nr:hypothetical protein [Sulfurifustis variabilis]BAU47077.1 hypothetical protein SVA_0496 [Sulfurifustis variabilis]